jgi:hypothetical protein
MSLVKSLLALHRIIDYAESGCVIYKGLRAHAMLYLILNCSLGSVICNILIISCSQDGWEDHIHVRVHRWSVDGPWATL